MGEQVRLIGVFMVQVVPTCPIHFLVWIHILVAGFRCGVLHIHTIQRGDLGHAVQGLPHDTMGGMGDMSGMMGTGYMPPEPQGSDLQNFLSQRPRRLKDEIADDLHPRVLLVSSDMSIPTLLLDAVRVDVVSCRCCCCCCCCCSTQSELMW